MTVFPITVESQELVGEIERIVGGCLKGWVHPKEGDDPVEILAVSPEGHSRGAALLERPDILYRYGQFGRSGYEVNLGPLVRPSVDKAARPVKIFFNLRGSQAAVVQIELDAIEAIRNRHSVEFSRVDNRIVEGTYSQRGDFGKVLTNPPLVLRNSAGQMASSVVFKPLGSQDDVGPRGYWSIRAELPLRFIVGSNKFTTFLETVDHAIALHDPVAFGVLYSLRADSDVILGWAVWPDDPSERVLVRISPAVDGERYYAEARATLFRRDLKNASGLDGFFGFRFRRPKDQDLHISLATHEASRRTLLLLNQTDTQPKVVDR